MGGGPLFVKDDLEEGVVDVDASIIISDEAVLSELVHEEIDAGACGANHFGEHFLGHFGEQVFRLGFFAVASEEQEGAGEALLTGVEELVNEIFFDADIAGDNVGKEVVEEGVLRVKHANHFTFVDGEEP